MTERKNIVRYHNDLNSITFYGFGAIDFDLFMSICSKITESMEMEVVISFDELRKMSDLKTHLSDEAFCNRLLSMNRKQLLSQGEAEDGANTIQFPLFARFKTNREEKTLTVKISEDAKYILYELKKNFTRFELQEFTTLEGKYAKTLYRLLKQYRTTGLYRVNLEEFRRIFDVPTNYKNKQINTFILKPAVETLGKYFDNLKYSVLYEPKRGKPVKGYEFTFTPEEVAMIGTKANATGRKKPVNAFHNFEQRQYSDEFWKLLDKKGQK